MFTVGPTLSATLIVNVPVALAAFELLSVAVIVSV